MRRASLALIGILAAGMLPVQGAAAGPAWVGRHPRDSDNYIGIGRADKRIHPEKYREIARVAALAEISLEISVRLRSESVSSSSETGGIAEEAYTRKTSAASANDLTGYRLADVHETDGEFWALYMLDKEEYARIRVDKGKAWRTWLAREVEGIEADLGARKIQAAADRLAGIGAAHSPSCTGESGPCAPRDAGEERIAPPSERMRTVLRNLELTSPSRVWTLDLRSGSGGKSGSATVHLRDAATETDWQGPLRIAVSERTARGKKACAIVTRPGGDFDLTALFLDCRLGAGDWRVAWTGPDSRTVALDIRAAILKPELAIGIVSDGSAEGKASAALLEEELWVSDHPRYRFVPERRTPDPSQAGEVLQIRIAEISEDSLSGMHFTTVRARLRFPGEDGWRDASGKAGHSDPGRSRRGALRDLARALSAD